MGLCSHVPAEEGSGDRNTFPAHATPWFNTIFKQSFISESPDSLTPRLLYFCHHLAKVREHGHTEKGQTMRNREALEEAVYDAFPSLDMSDIEKMETDKLEWMLEVRQGKRKDPAAMTQKKIGRPRKQQSGVVWEKASSGYEVRNGALVHVEHWHTSNEAGQSAREYVTVCGERVSYDGHIVASSRLKHFLETGQWVKRVPAPVRYRARVRTPEGLLHLGYFATREERDAAVFAYRLGISPNGLESA